MIAKQEPRLRLPHYYSTVDNLFASYLCVADKQRCVTARKEAHVLAHCSGLPVSGLGAKYLTQIMKGHKNCAGMF
jgi:hypothetical protein